MTYGELYKEFCKVCPVKHTDWRPYDEPYSMYLFLGNGKGLKAVMREDKSWIIKESSDYEWASTMFPIII